MTVVHFIGALHCSYTAFTLFLAAVGPAHGGLAAADGLYTLNLMAYCAGTVILKKKPANQKSPTMFCKLNKEIFQVSAAVSNFQCHVQVDFYSYGFHMVSRQSSFMSV